MLKDNKKLLLKNEIKRVNYSEIIDELFNFRALEKLKCKRLSHICRINLEPVFAAGSIPETSYNVMKNQKYCGEIKVALTFNPEVVN